MSDEKTVYLSLEGYQKLKDKLRELVEERRPQVIRQLAEAREKGDLCENAEYDAAKEAQAALETEIANLEQTLFSSQVVDNKNKNLSGICILSRVKLKNIKNETTFEYTLVSAVESSLREKKLSIESPLGQSLLGKKVGDKVVTNTPNGEIIFEIVGVDV
ncbi:MAG: transcription elongation factor GreA [Cytophagales bacterium]|jgi:transcription elongation factor GreA|nr:transcription elongation factor GreA [Cytophagales bacterium]